MCDLYRVHFPGCRLSGGEHGRNDLGEKMAEVYGRGGGRGKRGREAGFPKWRTVGEIGKLVRNIVPYFVSKTRQEAGTKKGKGTGTQEGGAKKGGATGTEGYRKRKV